MKLVQQCPRSATRQAYDNDKNILLCRFSASSCIQHSSCILHPEELSLSCPLAILKDFMQCMTPVKDDFGRQIIAGGMYLWCLSGAS